MTLLTEIDVLDMFTTPARPDSILADRMDQAERYSYDACEYVRVSDEEWDLAQQWCAQFTLHFEALVEDEVLAEAFGMFWLPK